MGLPFAAARNDLRTAFADKLPDDEGGHPLLVTGRYGAGRTLAWTSDVGPHWVPQPFVDWPGYARLWRQCLAWLAGI